MLPTHESGSPVTGVRIHITGIIQGVGFRPFVYSLAVRLGLVGWVRNTSAGVDIEVDGSTERLEEFARKLKAEAPPLAHIDELEIINTAANGFTRFEIIHSEAVSDAFQPISPDVCICSDCLRELFDPEDARYFYPFINCTNCGPRFTIIQDIPYDRPKTTMAQFEMCPNCQAEYINPLDRRFHAQPIACPVCGPRIWLEWAGEASADLSQKAEPIQRVIRKTQELLAAGKVVAIKGLGGFHLACDATNLEAVAELRRRKLRVDKPFALMMPDIDTIRRHCAMGNEEIEFLTSAQRPIVLLQKLAASTIVGQVAPQQATLGVMLPYTPLHYLLFSDGLRSYGAQIPEGGYQPPLALVMTSGNLSEEPIAIDNKEARQRLSALADAFLMHNRAIHIRCDDSVVRRLPVQAISKNGARSSQASLYPLRRSRGYAPFPVRLSVAAPPLLATGAQLKNAFCLARDRYAFLSHHIGDMENYETLQSFEMGVKHFEQLFRIRPQLIAYDLHPDYLATRYALERAERDQLPAVAVQHHHAHIAACMAEHGVPEAHPIIGVSFDGTGYGSDGAIWGGEFLLCQYSRYQRLAHLAYAPLPGGDAAVRKPARIALAYLKQAGLEWSPNLACVQALTESEKLAIQTQLNRGVNTAWTSSAGRLFDAVASLTGVRQKINYEAQAAIEFEELADPAETGAYEFALFQDSSGGLVVDWQPVIRAILEDMNARIPVPAISARFHNGLAEIVVEVCRQARSKHQTNEVALSGGVWQNMTLLEKTAAALQYNGFIVLLHHQVPANDGGLALGQAAIAMFTK